MAMHPDLRSARWLPRFSFGRTSVKVARAAMALQPSARSNRAVRVATIDGMRVFTPTEKAERAPALLWFHGGGFVMGAPQQDDWNNRDIAAQLGMVVVAPRYRLAPEHPAPAAVEDAYAALRYVRDHAAALGVDPERIAIGGASAGGGLSASLALYAHDRAEIRPVLQVLVYPMLDDRTVERHDVDERDFRLWTSKSNRYAWSAYLGGSAPTPYAAPARRDDLSGLPPAWIGVGTADLFHDEDVAYAKRLEAASVPVELYTVPDAFHGFDALYPKKPVTRAFQASYVGALRRAFG